MVIPMRYWTGTSQVFLLPKEGRKQESTTEKEKIKHMKYYVKLYQLVPTKV